MARKGKQVSRKRKAQVPEEDEKQNELILEEVLSISGKGLEKADGSPPAKLKRSASKPNETPTQPKKNAKKRSVSPSSSLSKQKKSTGKEEDEANTVVNEVKASTSERGDPVPNLPDGWRRQVAIRKSGKSAGQIDIYFYSPDGVKLRSRPDVTSYLKKNKSNLKIEEFDFSRTAKTAEVVVKKKKAGAENSVVPKKKSKTIEEEKSKIEVESKVPKSSEKVSAEVPPVPDTEENNADVKTNKDFPEEIVFVEINDKDCNSTTRKRKSQVFKEEEKKHDDEIEVSRKKLEKADESSSVRIKRSVQKSNEVTSTQPKRSNLKQKKGTGEDVEANTVVNEVKASTLERGDPVPNLPDGWRREVVVRKSGERAGQIDIYFYSPDGVKLRSRPDVTSYLKKHKSDLKIEEFDFSRSAKTSEAVVKKKAATENSMAPKTNNKIVQGEESKVEEDSTKNISMKVSKSSDKLSAKVPQRKNDAAGKSTKILKKILSKPKKTRR
ncbi:unnamed protein product [Larinioides sclopetarius]|uniref:MBD domain-containing protein n=1 Tax=Larinioides sclopetarius TaxID=280406 RepID=A0AAV2BV82_9ARAC